MISRRAVMFRVGWLAVAGAMLGMAACAARQRLAAAPPPKAARAEIRPLEDRVDVVLGRRLVMPVKVQGPLDPRRMVSARTDDGRNVKVELVWLSVRPDTAVTKWLPPAERWSVTPAEADRLAPGSGLWAVVLDLPLNAIGQGVWLNDLRVPLNWLPDPGSLGADNEAWRPPLGTAPSTTSLLALASPELASPLRRWRFHLLMAGLKPDRRPPAELDLSEPVNGLGGVVFDEPILEALARQTEARWQVALGTLWLADPELAERLKRRLVAAVDFGNGVLAPAWPTSQEDLDALLSSLLKPRVRAEEHAERALAWLEAQPAAAAWIIDDAGLRDAQTGRPVAACGIANLTERATLAWASLGEWTGAAGLTTVNALTAVRFPVTAPESTQSGSRSMPGTALLELHAGQWQTKRSVAWSSIRAAPPGLRIEPLLADWTMRGWIAGEPEGAMVPPGEWTTAALLYRSDQAASDGGEPGSRWTLLVECRTEDNANPDQESLRLWIGPFGSPSVIIKATAAGAILDERAPDQGLRGDFEGARITRMTHKWVAVIPLPDRALEADGTLRLGIERRDARGARATWPRPMLPWQIEPGRVAIHTRSWGDLGAPGAGR